MHAKVLGSKLKTTARTNNTSIIDTFDPLPQDRAFYATARARWPLCCVLGLITARTEFDCIDATACAIDLIHLGIIPDVIFKWANSAIESAIQDANLPKALVKDTRKRLTNEWNRVVALVVMKADCLQRVIRKTIQTYSATLKKTAKDNKLVTKTQSPINDDTTVTTAGPFNPSSCAVTLQPQPLNSLPTTAPKPNEERRPPQSVSA